MRISLITGMLLALAPNSRGCGQAEAPTTDQPSASEDHDEHECEPGQAEGEGEGAGLCLPSITLDPGSEAVCTSLEQSWQLVLDQHRSCTADTDCQYVPLPLCGQAVNLTMPVAHAQAIRQLQEAYSCPLPVAKCAPPPYPVACQEGVCQFTN